MSVQMDLGETSATREAGGLRKTLSVWGAIGVSIGLIGPSMAMNINPQGPAGLVGRAVPLVFLLATVGVLLVAYGFIRLCQHFNHAGSIYAFVGVTLGPRAGFVAGWALVGTYLAYLAATFAAVGIFASQFFRDSGLWSDAGWLPFAVVAMIGAAALSMTDTQLSVRTLLSVEAVTMTLIAIVALTIFGRLIGGHAPGDQSFTLSVFSVGSGVGVSSVFTAITFGFLSFAGFEAASTLGEETADPRRAIPIAVLACVVFAGLYFTLITAAESMGFGTSPKGVESFTGSGALMGDLGRTYVASWVGDLITLGASFGAFGAALAGLIAASRLIFAFGRDGLVPRALSATSRSGIPTRAIAGVMVFVALETFGLRLLATSDIKDIFFWTATYGTLALLVAYLMATVGAIKFLFLGRRALVRRWEIVVPLGAIAFLLYTLYKNIYPVPPSPYNLFPYVVAGWLAIGTLAIVARPTAARSVGERLRSEAGLGGTGAPGAA